MFLDTLNELREEGELPSFRGGYGLYGRQATPGGKLKTRRIRKAPRGGVKEALPPLGVVRPAHKVVKGHVEVVREGDEILIGWFARAILIPLIGHWSHIDGVCHLLLCKITHGSKFLQPFGESHDSTSSKIMKNGLTTKRLLYIIAIQPNGC